MGTHVQTGTRTALVSQPRSQALHRREPGPGQCKAAASGDVDRSQDRRFPTRRSRLVPMSLSPAKRAISRRYAAKRQLSEKHLGIAARPNGSAGALTGCTGGIGRKRIGDTTVRNAYRLASSSHLSRPAISTVCKIVEDLVEPWPLPAMPGLKRYSIEPKTRRTGHQPRPVHSGCELE